jgi:hypothetical protein
MNKLSPGYKPQIYHLADVLFTAALYNEVIVEIKERADDGILRD